MRVAMIAGTYRPEHCGVAHYTARLRDALRERGIETVVLTTREAARAADDPSVLGVVEDWRAGCLVPLARAVRAVNPDLLHLQHAAGTYRFRRSIFLLPLVLQAFRWRGPMVTTIHEYGTWHWRPRGVPSWLLEPLKAWGQRHAWWDGEDGWLLTRSKAVITTNRDAETIIRSRLPGIDGRLYRIPIAANVEVAAVDRSAARREVRSRCGWPEDCPIVVFFGFLHPVKGLETLFAAFRQLLSTCPQARLLLVGGVESLAMDATHAAEYWEKLHTRVRELGIGQQVHMTGYLPAEAASECLSAADLGVLPFHGGVVLKSGSLLAMMAHGLPVVATRHPCPDPELADESFVRLVPRRDPEALAAGLANLLGDGGARARYAAVGRELVRNFTWPVIAKRHREIYQRVLT